MYGKYIIFTLFTYISLAASNMAPFITKCKWDDSKCLKESTQKAIPVFADGLPELNVDKLDPLLVKHVDASAPNLKFTVSDITVTGLKDCEAKKVQWKDIGKTKLTIKILCTVDFNGKYEMKGQLFVLPIEGNGDLVAKVRKMLVTVEFDIINKEKDGKVYWIVKSWKHTFDLKDNSDVKFNNLFPDNEFLRNTTNELIAKNGNDVIREIGHPIIKALVGKVTDTVKKFFTIVPTEDLALD